MTGEQRPPRLINTATQERGRSSGLADGFDLARLDGTYAVLRLSAETEQRPEVKFRSGCWWMLAVNQVLLLLGNTSVTSFVQSELRWPRLTDAAASGCSRVM